MICSLPLSYHSPHILNRLCHCTDQAASCFTVAMAGEAKVAAVGLTTVLEFGGVPGASAMVLGLPVTVYAINLMCTKVSTQSTPEGTHILGHGWEVLW